MTTTPQSRTSAVLRQRVAADIRGMPFLWVLAMIVVAVVLAVTAVLRSGDITVSGWEFATQPARWYAGAVGVYLTAVYLPLYVTHGVTRREFTRHMPAFVAIFAVAYGMLIALGFAIESVAYGIFDWSQALSSDHLFDRPTQFPMVAVQYLFIGATWTAGGAMLGAAFYRDIGLGMLFVPIALVLVGAVEATAGPYHIGIPIARLPIQLWDLDFGGSLAVTVAVTATTVTISLLITWLLIRRIPMRTKPA